MKANYLAQESDWLLDMIQNMTAIDEMFFDEADSGVYHLKEEYFDDAIDDDVSEISKVVYTFQSNGLTVNITGKDDSDFNMITFVLSDIGTTDVGFPEGEIEEHTSD